MRKGRVEVSAPFRFPKFFVTNPSPCPYLAGKVERKVFTKLNGRNAGELNEALGRIEDGDAVLFFNFRADRARQITRALAAETFSEFDRGPTPPSVQIVTMTPYDEELPLNAAFPPQPMTNILADVLYGVVDPRVRIK